MVFKKKPQSTKLMKPIIIIPARLGSKRLAGKALATIGDHPMIVHVYRKAQQADCAPVVVATDDQTIKQVIQDNGGHAVMTAPSLPSGSDRVFAASQALGAKIPHDYIINLQGDLPNISPKVLRDMVHHAKDSPFDIVTPAYLMGKKHENDIKNPNVVKVILATPHQGAPRQSTPRHALSRALYFTRAPAPWGKGPYYHHVGIYGFRSTALKSFVKAPPSPLEQRENLEQLRALENNLTIGVFLTNSLPHGVDTKEDLDMIRAIMS